MYQHIELALDKLFDQYSRLKSPGKFYAHNAQPLAVYYPGMDKFIPTMSFICIVSILDDALSYYIRSTFNTTEPRTLSNRIDFLSGKGLLKDSEKLHTIRRLRNAYAHEPERYSNWDDFENIYLEIRQQLKHLGI